MLYKYQQLATQLANKMISEFYFGNHLNSKLCDGCVLPLKIKLLNLVGHTGQVLLNYNINMHTHTHIDIFLLFIQ